MNVHNAWKSDELGLCSKCSAVGTIISRNSPQTSKTFTDGLRRFFKELNFTLLNANGNLTFFLKNLNLLWRSHDPPDLAKLGKHIGKINEVDCIPSEYMPLSIFCGFFSLFCKT